MSRFSGTMYGSTAVISSLSSSLYPTYGILNPGLAGRANVYNNFKKFLAGEGVYRCVVGQRISARGASIPGGISALTWGCMERL